MSLGIAEPTGVVEALTCASSAVGRPTPSATVVDRGLPPYEHGTDTRSSRCELEAGRLLRSLRGVSRFLEDADGRQ